MSNELIKFELQEKDLELVVNEKTLGSLTTNARQIKEMVERALPNYDIINYSEDNITFAKKDKAMLNGASKALNDKRIQFEKDFMQPFSEFKTVVGETVALIKECSGRIDTVIKQSEENEQKTKRVEIEKIWESKNFALVSLQKIFDAKWLNKGTTLKTVEAEIATKIANVNDDIKTIEAIGEDADLLKPIYLDTLNLNSTIQYAHRLKENRERARVEAEARAAVVPVTPASRVAPVHEVAAPAVVKSEELPKPAPVAPELLTRAFKVTATKEQIISLADFMDKNGIQFSKIAIAD